MKKMVLRTLFVLGVVLSGITQASAVVSDYQDWWWSPEHSGMGFNVGQNGDTLVVAWYLFGDDRKGTYFLLSGPLEGNRVEGQLAWASGPPPGPGYDAAQVKRGLTGTASIEFVSTREAVFHYDYAGRSGSIALQRFAFNALETERAARLAGRFELDSCTPVDMQDGHYWRSIWLDHRYLGADWRYPASEPRKVLNKRMNVRVQQRTDKAGYDLEFTLGRGICQMTSGKLSQDGGMLSGSGRFLCKDYYDDDVVILMPFVFPPVAGNLEVKGLRLDRENSVFEFAMAADSGETCRAAGVFNGVTVPIPE